MRAVNNLKFAENYLSGFNDCIHHETVAKTLIGIIKIISYISIIPPIYFLYNLAKTKKIVDLQRSFDDNIDAGKIYKTFEKTIALDNQKQNKLIDYLVNKLINFDENDNIELEKSRFQKAFKQLDFESQPLFFQRAHQSHCLKTALNWIPKDISALNFISGTANPIYYSDKSRSSLEWLLIELPTWTHLQKVRLNLQGLGFYSAEVDRSVQLMASPGGKISASVGSKMQGRYEWNGATYEFCNDNFQIGRAVQEIKLLIDKHPDLEWQIYFANFGVGGQGTDVTMAFDGKQEYLTNFRRYLQK